jgi:nitric oxide reductase NorE protein
MVAAQMDTALEEARARGRLPGDLNVWIFVLLDLCSFVVYFGVFMVYRVEHGAVFLEAQQHLSLAIGTINTVVLLTSSRFIALSVDAVRRDEHARAQRMVWLGALCGIVFVGLKGFEWWREIANGHTLQSDDFFMFYVALTGVHLLHVLLGLLVLAFVIYELREPRLRRVGIVESSAVYWHMVDLVWVVLFALVYLMR